MAADPLIEMPSLSHIVGSLSKRANRPGQVWGDGGLVDTAGMLRLEAAAASARLERDSAVQLGRRRMASGRQAMSYSSDGPMGLFLYAVPGEQAAELVPLLKFGQWLHIGAQTTAGLGHFELLTGLNGP